jgi:hypothetical protein
MIRSRAADDFAMIRARLEGLRRERAAQAAPGTGDRSESGPRPYYRARNSETEPEGHRPPRSVYQKLFG